MTIYIDPPEGWRYGFPKPFTFKSSSPDLSVDDHGKEAEAWFIDQGYPKSMIDRGMLEYCGLFEVQDEEEDEVEDPEEEKAKEVK